MTEMVGEWKKTAGCRYGMENKGAWGGCSLLVSLDLLTNTRVGWTREGQAMWCGRRCMQCQNGGALAACQHCLLHTDKRNSIYFWQNRTAARGHVREDEA